MSIADDYGQYLTAEEYASLIDSADGDFVGIGVHATFDVDTEGVYIFGVIPNSPAEKAGIKKGDVIIKAEGIVSSEKTYYELLDSVRGEAGTEVSVTVLRDGEEHDFKIVRQAVASENVFYEKLDNNVAFIRILSFADETVSEEFTKKLALAQSEGCDKFVFDVRNNSGGYLGEICDVLDLLLPEGPIINIVDKDGNTKTQNSDANCIKGKMAVLCNKGTASAAELFTAALRDYKLADIIGTRLAAWKGGVISQYIFVVLVAIAAIMVLNFIPSNINAVAKAKELEMEKIVLNAELTESRISTMMSQIRPHFIYNTLGSIEQLCKLDPPKAGDLVHNFAKYLRGNFGELDNPKPIRMSQEMEHVHHYISIENVRFPDMTFTFEMNSDDFHIPALTIQPIVENAIKHGLMKLPKGGTIRVVSYETDTHYCVLVEDDGAGFDTSVLLEERKHVGIRNIRARLEAMVNGTLEIESTIGVGTKVHIRIPKEADQ